VTVTTTVVVSLGARKGVPAAVPRSDPLFTLTVASPIILSILVSPGASVQRSGIRFELVQFCSSPRHHTRVAPTGALTTVFSFVVIPCPLIFVRVLAANRAS
jgi:hypothetical protein